MHPPHLVLLYGTETVNPEDIAKCVQWEGLRRRCRVVARPLDSEPFASLTSDSDSIVLFIVSTMGQGEAPINLLPFWKSLMRKSLLPGSLSSLQCAVIGLGDSSYAKYNYVGKKLFKRLKQLGADVILDLCLGDDQHDYGYWGAVDPFLSSLWVSLTDRFQLPHFTFAADYLPPATFSAAPRDSTIGDVPDPSSPRHFVTVRVIKNERATPEDYFQETRLIRLESAALKHEPGDVIAVLPENSSSDVEELLQLIQKKREQEVNFAPRSEACLSPSLFSFPDLQGNHRLGDLLRTTFDLHAVPKRSFFSLLWKFSRDETEKGKLKELSSTEGFEELYEYCLKPKRMIIEVLRDFPNTSSQIPIEYLPDLMPAIRAREFSIASSPKAFPGEIHILVVVVKFQTRIKQMRRGFCSNFLAERGSGDEIRACINKGTFAIPPEKPLIMIGPGSGVAPFRGIVQDRVANGVSDNMLFFGCRNRSADFYFEQEWMELVDKKSLTLFTAFSRDQIQKDYVQHRMWEHRALVWEWIVNRDAVLLIAGSSNQMPTAVREELVRIANESGQEGDTFVTRLENGRRLQYECWD